MGKSFKCLYYRTCSKERQKSPSPSSLLVLSYVSAQLEGVQVAG